MTILITGGSKGIGRGIAERFARGGATVIVNYANDDEAAAETGEAITRLGGNPHLLKVDISTVEGMEELCRLVGRRVSRIDQVVHGAVWPLAKPVLEISPDEFLKATWMNGGSLLGLVQGLRPLMARGSSVFQMSSRGSKLAVPNYVAVGAPKAMGEALVRYLAVALAPDGIRVNTIACSTVLTDAIRAIRPDAEERAERLASINPSGRNVEPADVGELIHHLASPELEMLTGREFFLDGGIYAASDPTPA